MKVKAVAPYQVNHEGTLHKADTGAFDAPDAEARRWIAAGWAAEVDEEKAVEAPAEVVGADTDDESVVVDLDDYHTGAGWYEINGERVRGKAAARKLLEGDN